MPQPYSLSFILDEHRYEADFMAEQAEADALFKQLDQARRSMTDRDKEGVSALLSIQDLQVYRLKEGHQGADGPEAFVRYVLEEGLHRNMDQPRAEDVALIAAAKALDAVCVASEAQGVAPVYLAVDYTWNNGGGDDNAYSATLKGTLDQEKALFDFVDQFEQWLETNSHGYDLSVGPEDGNPPTDTLKSAVRDLVGTLDDNYKRDSGSLGSAWANVLREAIAPPKDEVTARRRARPH